ncbi:MFS transporter [Streptomyces physcomitrii]|uniref:MFS transporter n=1 Tax=Streptomyces physcomitrii TaxID=2724184 RepID=A0ABX1GY96_9ACTN|nr:MFS transporter [Streptomyces physcomitrii]NKI39781.1 MFS transporter [Streptomyces physcomitrii]
MTRHTTSDSTAGVTSSGALDSAPDSNDTGCATGDGATGERAARGHLRTAATPTGDRARPRPERQALPWLIAALAALALITAGAAGTLAGLLVGPLHREFGWSRSTIGAGSLVSLVMYGAGAPFAAALMDRFGMRRVVSGALGLAGTGAALTATMAAPWQFALYWGLLVGLGSGAAALAFAATVAERWFARRRGLVTGILTAAGVVGQFVFLPVLAGVIGAHGWRAAVLAVAVAALGTGALVLLFLRDHPADVGQRPYGATEFVPRRAPEPGAARRAVRVLGGAVRSGPFWLLAGSFAVCGASTNGVMWNHFAPAAHDHGMPVPLAASLLSLVGIFNVAGTVASGWLSDRLDVRRLLASYYALRGLSLCALPLLLSASARPQLLAFMVVFGLLDVATVPPTIALCRERFGADATVVFGWVGAAHQLGAGLLALLGGAARDVFGSYDPMWVATGALCAAAAILALAVPRPRPGSRA